MQGNTTYYDDTRYDNLTSLVSSENPSPDKLSAKLAKLSALDRVKSNVNKIKVELKSEKKVEETAPVSPEVTVEVPAPEVTPEVAQEVPDTPTVEAETSVEHPTKESLEERTQGITFYNKLGNSSADSLGRKLRVKDPEVPSSAKYALNTLGVDFVKENIQSEVPVEAPVETELEVQPEIETTSMEAEEKSTDNPIEQSPTFDFSALPGVGETTEFSQVETPMETELPAYEEHMTSEEQDSRLNDYLNRDTAMDTVSSSTITDLERYRKLKQEIEEAKKSLQQVRENVSYLQQEDAVVSEQLAMRIKELDAEKEALTQERLAETTELNNLTQLLREKKALMGEEEFTKSKAA